MSASFGADRDAETKPAPHVPGAAPPARPRFPDLADLSPLGQGGMGTVFRARQVSLDRLVAVKTLRPELADDEDMRRRFDREAKALARIEHRNVVPVYATGEADGRPYYLMRYVSGRTVEAWAEGRPYPEVARIFARAARAVEAAHRAGVLHRDLKPENILVDAEGEPVVVDFGLAKRQEAAEESLSARGPVLGTPDYVAPEVAEGEAHTGRSDVYGLGATLFRVLAGRPPFPGDGLLKKLRRIASEDPPLVRSLVPSVPEPLQAICLKAMERRPEERYPAAQALAEDLERFLGGEPVLARPSLYTSLLERRVRAQLDEVERWEREGLLSRRERTGLAEGYETLVEGEKDSIFEVERLTPRLVFLYVGVLVLALGPYVLVTLAADAAPADGPAGRLAFRLAASVLPFAGLAWVGRRLWRGRDFRTALPFLFGAALLVAPIAWIALHEVPALRQTAEGQEIGFGLFRFDQVLGIAAKAEAQRLLDAKLLLVVLAALAAAAGFGRATGSAAFVWYGTLAALLVWYFAAALLGWRALEPHEKAATWLPAAALLLGIGVPLDVARRRAAARPFYILGFALFSAAWGAYALHGYPLRPLGPFRHGEELWLSFALGGLLALGLGIAADRLGTRLLYRYALVPFVLAAAATLVPLGQLVAQRLWLWEVILPLVCLGFIGLSVVFQRKNLLYTGSAYLAVAVFQISRNHFEDSWAWPLLVLAAGLAVMAGAWALPRLMPGVVERGR